MRGFTSFQFYLDTILNQFDIFAIAEHWLFEEQLGKLEHLTNAYTGFGVASQNNPDILSGQRAHGGVGMLWKTSLTSLASKLPIDCDRIVGAKFVLDSHEPMFILAVHLPSSNHSLDEFHETLDLLWVLYEYYCDHWITLVLGDFNGALGYLGGDKISSEPTARGKLINEFLNYFNLFAANLNNVCSGPLDTFYSDDGLSSSAIDLIVVPRTLLQYINWVYVFEKDYVNLSDHLPIALSIKISVLQHCDSDGPTSNYTRNEFPGISLALTKFLVFIQYLWLRS